MNLFRRRTVTVYLDGQKALKFKRVRGLNGERSLDLIHRAPGISDERVGRIRDDILRRWALRDGER